MKKISCIIAVAFITGGLATHGWCKDYASISAIKKDGMAVVGKTVTLRLMPKGLIVESGVFSMSDQDGSPIKLSVPGSMMKKVKAMKTGVYYNCTIKIDSVSSNTVKGTILSVRD